MMAASTLNACAAVNSSSLPLPPPELDVPREIDPENPVAAHPSDCHVYYIYNYPMTCGEESVFDPGTLSCRAPSDVAGSRPECAGGEETEASDE